MHGTLKPGQRLKEAEIAELLSISRTPIRHAIQTLEKEGLIETIPHRGARVSSYSTADLDEMYDLRALLEGRGAELAAGRINSAQLSILNASSDRFDRLSAGDDVDALVAENMLFHTTILEAAGSDRLAAMLRTVVAVPLVYQAYAWFSADDKQCSERAHRDLVAALSDRDAPAAGLIMRKHLLDSRDVLLTRMHDQLNETNGSLS
jgi:DNA-binding GntR family transcriptional regulator